MKVCIKCSNSLYWQVTFLLEVPSALQQLMAPNSSAIRFQEENLKAPWVRNDCRHALPKANLGVAEHWAKAWLSAQHADVGVLLPELWWDALRQFEISIPTYTSSLHIGRDPLDKCCAETANFAHPTDGRQELSDCSLSVPIQLKERFFLTLGMWENKFFQVEFWRSQGQ